MLRHVRWLRPSREIRLTDDLDGSNADGTVWFGLDGTEYEIDLNAEYVQALRDALARQMKAARRPGRGARPHPRWT